MRRPIAAIAFAAALPALAQRAQPAIYFEGNEAFSNAELEALARAQVPSLSTEEGLERISLEVLAAYFERGFVEARVEPPVRVGDGAVRVRIHEGPPYRIGRIDFEGRFRVPTEALRRRIAVRTGEPLQRSTIIADVALLNQLEGRLVVPLTRLDTRRHLVDLTFSVE
jgi:outer membrane protein assembly factor BamA